MSHGNSEAEAEAEYLCSLVDSHCDALSAARLGRTFRLGEASFRLHAKDRNTIYRVRGKSDWFLKLCRSGAPGLIAREKLGAETVKVLSAEVCYAGASVSRVSLAPPYVLTSAIEGMPLNRVLGAESWKLGTAVAKRLEQSFSTLGRLLATLHVRARVEPDIVQATKRPLEDLSKRLREAPQGDPVVQTISRWLSNYEAPVDEPQTFIHGHMRLDNVIRVGTGLGFVDWEHCGSGPLYQDLFRPVTSLLHVRAVIGFPHQRATRCLKAYLGEYRKAHSFDAERLSAYVGARLSRDYLDTCRRKFPPFIGGLPVSRARLGRLTTAVLREGIDSVTQT